MEARLREEKTNERDPTDPAALVRRLSSPNGQERKLARERLVEAGPTVVPLVAPLLNGPEKQTRWEAAKALSGIGSMDAAPALLPALEDEAPGVRWLAASGLVAAGREVIPLVLRAAIQKAASSPARRGLARVLRVLARGDAELTLLVSPVFEALDGLDAADKAPPAAADALEAIRMHGLPGQSPVEPDDSGALSRYLFDSKGDWVAMQVGVYVFDTFADWIGWLPWGDCDVVDLEGHYFGTIVEGDRLYHLSGHPYRGYPAFPGYPPYPELPPPPALVGFDKEMPMGASDVKLRRF